MPRWDGVAPGCHLRRRPGAFPCHALEFLGRRLIATLERDLLAQAGMGEQALGNG